MSRLFFAGICFLFFSFTSLSQTASAEKQQERYQEQVEENKQKYITGFLKTLDVDDFQKEIIKQTMFTYFDEVVEIQKLGLKNYEAKDAVLKMRTQHFADVRAIVSEDTMVKIEDALTGEWNPKDDKKKKKKKKKSKKNLKNDN